ncbi:hypothetical protein [Paenibacillus kribbensis]|uniref:hypothetical protein n=1 Tax=Paenibacillus kribbensis TaxID=172713 RepID=UPI000837CFC7|nr:hypothetical protein [Paenibacillus kribbensis]
MKLSQEKKERIVKHAKKITQKMEGIFAEIAKKVYDKPIEKAKREFFLEYREEMTEDEIRELRYRISIRWIVPIFGILFLLFYLLRRLFT